MVIFRLTSVSITSSIEVVIHIEDSWNMTINIDSIEVVIDTEDNWNMPINIDPIEVVIDSKVIKI